MMNNDWAFDNIVTVICRLISLASGVDFLFDERMQWQHHNIVKPELNSRWRQSTNYKDVEASLHSGRKTLKI